MREELRASYLMWKYVPLFPPCDLCSGQDSIMGRGYTQGAVGRDKEETPADLSVKLTLHCSIVQNCLKPTAIYVC